MLMVPPHMPPPLIAFLAPRARPETVVKSYRYLGRWQLEMARDPFTGGVACTLRSGPMTFTTGAMTFQFSKRIDTFPALYRIDDRPAASWRSNAMALAARRVKIADETLDNPSRGQVLIPDDLLSGAHVVSIRIAANRAVTTFRLDGLAPAVEVVRATACGPSFGQGY
jgi:hypothetical protein